MVKRADTHDIISKVAHPSGGWFVWEQCSEFGKKHWTIYRLSEEAVPAGGPQRYGTWKSASVAWDMVSAYCKKLDQEAEW